MILGFGLLSMKRKVEHLNGALGVNSISGEGFSISIKIPKNMFEGER